MVKQLTSNTSYFIVCEASHTIKYDVFDVSCFTF